jgi:hypothetical protein
MFVMRASPAPRDSICGRLTWTSPVVIAWTFVMFVTHPVVTRF